jgi:hypothetical protein
VIFLVYDFYGKTLSFKKWSLHVFQTQASTLNKESSFYFYKELGASRIVFS